MAELSGVEVLQSEIEKAKDKLRGYNENIRKLTGRDPSRPGIRRLLSNEGTEREENDYPNRAARGRGRIFGMARHSIMEDSGPPAKRRAVGGAFSRLGPVPARRRDREDSPYEEELPNKLSVHSSVVATSRESKNRREIMQEQTKDKEGMQRNRRMFGLLLGTLNKFRTESKTMETKEVQRKKIEEKVEENAEKEKRKFKQETKLLIEEMHLEQSKISRLQQKMEMVQEHAEREGEVRKLKNFIVTKTKPRIFWKPQQMSAALENKLKESRKFVDGMLQESNDRLEKEIKELMEREYKREERIKMRLREDGLLEDEGKGEVGEAGENNVEGMGESGRVVEVKEEIDQENPVADRLGGDHEDERLDAEIEDLGDSRKKSRRTVVVERDVSSGSESEDMEQGNHGTADQDTDQANLDKAMEVSKDIDQPSIDESGKKGETDDDLSSDRHRDGTEPGSNMSEGENSDIERQPQPPRERQRNKDGDEHRHKARSHKESRKDKKRDEMEDSEERDADRRRRSEDKRPSKRDSGEKGRTRRDSREEKRDKERRRDSHDSGKKSSSRRTKDRKRYSDSEESDAEVKQEKEVSKNKDTSHSESSNRDRDAVRRRSKVVDNVTLEID